MSLTAEKPVLSRQTGFQLLAIGGTRVAEFSKLILGPAIGFAYQGLAQEATTERSRPILLFLDDPLSW